MLPYTQNVSTLIPFDVNNLIDKTKIDILTEVPVVDNFVHKAKLSPEVLNPEFLKWLQDRDLDVQNVVIWHWLALDPHIAHIDCNGEGEILPAAVNWTLTYNKSQVQFYNMPGVDKTVMYGNEASTDWVTPNVTAYIPVDVKGITPADIWDDQGPCVINTSVPHIIVAPEIRTSASLQFIEPWDFETILKKLSNADIKVITDNQSNPLSETLDDCVFDYPVVDTGWVIKRWFKVDLERLRDWHKETMERYGDWVWRYGTHKYMWKNDPNEKLEKPGAMPDTGWLMLTWGDDTKGPVPWLRIIAKDEYNADMPQNRVDHSQGLGARECCFGYGLEIFENMPIPPHDIQIAIHTPGTALPAHQDGHDKFRFHIAIETDPDAKFTIAGKELHIPADGWCYIVNTTHLHSTDNRSNTDRIHIYGNIWVHDVLTLDLSNCETIL